MRESARSHELKPSVVAREAVPAGPIAPGADLALISSKLIVTLFVEGHELFHGDLPVPVCVHLGEDPLPVRRRSIFIGHTSAAGCLVAARLRASVRTSVPVVVSVFRLLALLICGRCAPLIASSVLRVTPRTPAAAILLAKDAVHVAVKEDENRFSVSRRLVGRDDAVIIGVDPNAVELHRTLHPALAHALAHASAHGFLVIPAPLAVEVRPVSAAAPIMITALLIPSVAVTVAVAVGVAMAVAMAVIALLVMIPVAVMRVVMMSLVVMPPVLVMIVVPMTTARMTVPALAIPGIVA